MNNDNKKINLLVKNKKIILIIGVVLIGLAVGAFFLFNNGSKAGIIKGDDVVYSPKIKKATYYDNKQMIEIESIDKSIDNIVVTSDMIKDMENKKYNLTIKEALTKQDITNKEISNIMKSLDLKIVNKNTSLKDYYAKVTGFKSSKEFIKFCEDAFELIKKEHKIKGE